MRSVEFLIFVAMAIKNNDKTKGKNADKTKKDKVAPADWSVDQNQKYQGTVVFFNKNNGYGFIKPAQSGLVPNDEVIVVWDAIKTDDRWPFLHKNLEVQFQLVKTMKKNGSGCYIKAAEVYRADGSLVNLGAELDSKRQFIHSQSTRFTGIVKFYNMRLGFGFVTLDDGFSGVEHISKEVRVSRQEIVCNSNEVPMLRAEMPVEFGIQVNLHGKSSCYCVTQPGGGEFTRTGIENRETIPGSAHSGVVSFYNLKSGWGYLKPNNIDALPKSVRDAIQADTKKAIEKKGKDMESMIYFRRSDCKSSGILRRGDAVNFEVYIDHRGAGAHNVTN